MKSLFLAWQAPDRSPKSRAWFPVGRLDVEAEEHDAAANYRFRYTGGARAAHEQVGFEPLISFPNFRGDYRSEDLFPLFQNRVLSSKRSDFSEYVSWLDLTPDNADPISILAVSGGDRVTDNLEVFPKVVPEADGSFHIRFFLHGMRHVGARAIERARELEVGEELKVVVELNNPATRLAIPIMTDDYLMLGWAPRYLVEDLLICLPNAPEITAKVAKINHGHAPLNQSVLIDYSGRAPEHCELMSSPDFTPLIV